MGANQAINKVAKFCIAEKEIGCCTGCYVTFADTIKSLDGFLACYDGSKLKGYVLAPVIYEKGVIKSTKRQALDTLRCPESCPRMIPKYCNT